jgi:hypothetical protein
MVTTDAIVQVLREAGEPLTVGEIAARVGADVRECDAILWQTPDRFVWQPGHKWAVATGKTRLPAQPISDVPDARTQLTSPSGGPRQLRAVTLSSGLVISVTRRPLDTDAFFSVRSAGNTVTLTLNSAHELFAKLPMPFDDSRDGSAYKELCEVLLSAWALYEDGLPGGSTKRATEDARLLWGRRVVEMLREQD